ncbi:Uncharacterised protein [uncultured archaeon]|nr:Uncharacterised protein [uncultured archaeon]
MAMEVITTPDRDKRDQMFQELRNSDQANEREVVKFSGVEQLTPMSRDAKTGRIIRATYRSTYSVAYPTS